MDNAEFDEFVLANMPYFIAVNYQRLLETQNPQERVKLILHIYNLVIRTLTISLVSQYLIQDREDLNEPSLNDLLLHTFPTTFLTLDIWQKIFFTLLRVYKSKSNRLFMPELHDFYWDTSK